jgi:hypothetical protein
MRGVAIAVLTMGLASSAWANMIPPQTSTPRTYFAGTWSFDGTCASGDGMVLHTNGKAAYDEWGTGLWAIGEDGARLVLIVEDISEEADRRKEAEMIEFLNVQRTGSTLWMKRASDGAKIKAKRCLAPAR